MLKNIFQICLVVCAGNTLIGASREALIEGAAMARGAAAAEARIAAQRMARPTHALPIRPTTGPASTSSRIPAPSILGSSASSTSGVAARAIPPIQASQQRGFFGFFGDGGRAEFEEKIKKQGYVGQQDIQTANKYLREIINGRVKAATWTMVKSPLKFFDQTRATDDDFSIIFDPFFNFDDIEPLYLGLLSDTGAPHVLQAGLRLIDETINSRKKKNIHPGYGFARWLAPKVDDYLSKATQVYSSAIAKNALALSLLKEAAIKEHVTSIKHILIRQAIKLAGDNMDLILNELIGEFMLGGLSSNIYDHSLLETFKEEFYARARSQQQQQQRSQNSREEQQKKSQQEQSQESQRQNRQQSTQSAPPARPYSELARMKIGEMHRFVMGNTGRGPWIILGLDPQTASKESIKKARGALMQKFHPDRAEQEDSKRATEITAAINAAYEQAMQRVSR